jgi:hypothetical protein
MISPPWLFQEQRPDVSDKHPFWQTHPAPGMLYLPSKGSQEKVG